MDKLIVHISFLKNCFEILILLQGELLGSPSYGVACRLQSSWQASMRSQSSNPAIQTLFESFQMSSTNSLCCWRLSFSEQRKRKLNQIYILLIFSWMRKFPTAWKASKYYSTPQNAFHQKLLTLWSFQRPECQKIGGNAVWRIGL